MIRKPTQLEKHEWWIAYGLDLRWFVPCDTGDGIVHWVADAYAHQEPRPEMLRVCDMDALRRHDADLDLAWDSTWRLLPDEEVSCMACIVQSCCSPMMGGIA